MSIDKDSKQAGDHPTNTLGVVGFCFAMASILIGFLSPVGAIVSLLGISKKPNGLAVAGLVISIISFFVWGIVVSVIVVLSLSARTIFTLQEESLQKSAKVEIKTLADASKMFRLNVGSYPTSLDDLSTPPRGLTRNQWGGPYLASPINSDPWQTPYDYLANELDDRVSITSAGPDKQMGTEDDISND